MCALIFYVLVFTKTLFTITVTECTNTAAYARAPTSAVGALPPLASTPPGMPGTHPPIFLVGGTSTGISPQYYYVLSDIADQYWLPSVRSASSGFHSAIRRHQFASVRQADSRLTRLVPPTVDATVCPCIPAGGTTPRPSSRSYNLLDRPLMQRYSVTYERLSKRFATWL